MVPFSVKVPVASEVVFPAGALWMGVEAQTEFGVLVGQNAQAIDKDTGLPLWSCTVIDLEEPDETARFRRSTELKVRIAAHVAPVPPLPRVPGYPPVVAFIGLSMTPYLDAGRCSSGRERCGCRLAYSLRATGVVEFTGDLAGNARPVA
jgi:hypothetical protein